MDRDKAEKRAVNFLNEMKNRTLIKKETKID